jgi:hypothetical protein
MLARWCQSKPFILRLVLNSYAGGVPTGAMQMQGLNPLFNRFKLSYPVLRTCDEQVGYADGEKNRKEDRTKQSSEQPEPVLTRAIVVCLENYRGGGVEYVP